MNKNYKLCMEHRSLFHPSRITFPPSVSNRTALESSNLRAIVTVTLIQIAKYHLVERATSRLVQTMLSKTYLAILDGVTVQGVQHRPRYTGVWVACELNSAVLTNAALDTSFSSRLSYVKRHIRIGFSPSHPAL